ncbi:MAG TPA: segregation/condensation protein A [Myxococcales bacterium]|jgi:segregation and condensation protein A|nr:segregation/condensation protein A [Myxococcales bacterium]
MATEQGEAAGTSGQQGEVPKGTAVAATGEGAPSSPTTAFRVALPTFEGPLDLLLHLIREHKIDILDIPISLITQKYLEALKAMKEMDLDIAGEFILMAATLAHIKSRMLLPDPEPLPEEDQPQQGDPREELVRRLLEYQKYKAAAEELARQDLLDREVFTRRARIDQIPFAEGEVGLVEVSVFKLVEALDGALKTAKLEAPHQVVVDRISLSETINEVVEKLRVEPRTSFFTILEQARERPQIVITFLALLEMAKLGLIRIYQEEDGADILVWARDPDSLGVAPEEIKDDYK